MRNIKLIILYFIKLGDNKNASTNSGPVLDGHFSEGFLPRLDVRLNA